MQGAFFADIYYMVPFEREEDRETRIGHTIVNMLQYIAKQVLHPLWSNGKLLSYKMACSVSNNVC